MTLPLRRLLSVAAVMAALLALALAVGSSALAQGTSATPSPIDTTMSHPAHIHSGTCATLGAIVYPLNDVAAPGAPVTMMGTPMAGTPMAISPMSTPVMTGSATPMSLGPVVAESVTVVKVSLADLEKAPFAVNVHESLAKIGDYIACGDITGAITNNELSIDLKQLNSSGLTGVATLHDNGDGTTTVTVELMQGIA